MIAIDIETTGLNPQLDAITEIAALKFEGDQIIDSFQTLVNPNRPIPPNIIHLTHITNDMVHNAPQIVDVLDDFSAFIGDDVLVGQNIGFDLGFLRRGGILHDNRTIDTYQLASILLPCAPRYNLGSLAQQFGVDVETQHRALSDCRLTFHVYHHLLQKAYDLPLTLLVDIIAQFVGTGWSETDLLRRVVQERLKMGEKNQPVFAIPFPNFAKDPVFTREELKPNEMILPLDEDETAAPLEYGGQFSRYFSLYEQRPQQIEMLRTVANAFTHGRHMLIEAGTGTGKSFAYLLPGYQWAKMNGQRVVISTNTINLQDQLIQKDIPALSSALQEEIIATVLKGRSNYLCPKRFQQAHSNRPSNVEELRIISKIMVWLQEGGQGDRSEITLNGPIEREIWSRLNAEYEGCRPKQCPFFREGKCPFYAARARAMRSHLIIVNHALLLSDIAMGGGVLPEYRYLVIDEGHHLESAATGALSAQLSQFDLMRRLQEMGSAERGCLGRILVVFSSVMQPDEATHLADQVHKISESLAHVEKAVNTLFFTIQQFMTESRDGAPLTVYGQQLRITSAIRTAAGWSDVEIVWDEAHQQFMKALRDIESLWLGLSNLDDLSEDQQEQTDQLGELLKSLKESRDLIQGLISSPDQQNIYWIDISAINNRLSLNAAPLSVGGLIEKLLWHEKDSIILTSATLTTDNSFDYIRERLSADEADELAVGSPFDYENSVLFYVPKDIPDPNQGSAQRMVEMTTARLAKATNGRMLVLFTSYAQLKKTANAIGPELQAAGITLFEQGEGASASSLLETFRETEQAVLLGTRSFWEGVDIQGEQLSVVIIVKLPFDVPSDPIIAARSECFENPFAEYSLPEAILKFRQGFGRLIRSNSDRGIVAVLDNRLVTKRYGREFINSIPQCTLRFGTVRDLPAEAQRWLNI